MPGLTQLRPDLLVRVDEGPLGAETYYIEYERYDVRTSWAREKLGPSGDSGHRAAPAGAGGVRGREVAETGLGRRR